jgi:hypothetical protein
MPTQNRTKKDKETPKRRRTTATSPAAPPAAPVADESKYAPTAWGGQSSGPQDLVLPSGQLCLARKPGIQQLMVEGVLHRMDNLSSLVQSKHIKKGGSQPQLNVASLFGDQEAMQGILHTVDRVVCAVVLRPHVEMTPNDPTRKVNGVIYADTIDLEDKMFLFNWALGGSSSLEEFRRESEAVVGSLAVVEPVESEAE